MIPCPILAAIALLGAPEPAIQFTVVPEGASTEEIVRLAAHVTPSERQLRWAETPFAAFVHFGMNTFTDREWGEGNEDPALFNPTDFDAHQWVEACKAAGIEELILTAKHHDGFCLWPSAFTEHSVKSSPWREGNGDLVREVAEACREGGIRFGFYLSPWDRHEPTYGDSPAYNEHFANQLRELLTGYGPIAEVWFDGACGEGPNGKRQEYDFPSYYRLIRGLQPDAVISICGLDVRWCGNEAGSTRETEWSVIPVSGEPGVQVGCDAMAADLGGRDKLAGARLLAWYPSQVDVSIRPGWFYHTEQDAQVRSLGNLLDIWYGAVGGNCQLLLNIPPDQRGRFHEVDVQRLAELGANLRATFARNLAAGARASADSETDGHPASASLDADPATWWTTAEGVTTATLELDLPIAVRASVVRLEEAIRVGQRVESFAVEARVAGEWREVGRGTTVGACKLLRFPAVTTDGLRVRILSARDCPTLASIGLFLAPSAAEPPAIARDDQGNVSLTAPEGMEIRYWLAGVERKYEAPFALPEGGTVRAVSIPLDDASSPIAPAQSLPSATMAFGPLAGGDPPTEETPQPIAADPAAWAMPQPNGVIEPVARTSETLPLSDQANAGGWVAYEPMWDEFDGDGLDAGKWYPRNPTWLGRQPAWFWERNVEVRDGALHLTMRKEEAPEADRAAGYHTWTSAAVQSVGTVRYGYFEVRAKAMKSHGSSAFWFYNGTPDWWTEIDVFEIGGGSPAHATLLYMTCHWFHAPGVNGHWSVGGIWQSPTPLADDWHVYGLEWDEAELRFYFDGVLVRRGPNTSWTQPLTMNFDSETMPEWFGLPEDKDLPSTYSVDYVRSWKRSLD